MSERRPPAEPAPAPLRSPPRIHTQEFTHVTFICDSGWLPNRTSQSECLLDSISTGQVSSSREGPDSIPIENKLAHIRTGWNINMYKQEPRIALSGVLFLSFSLLFNDTCTTSAAAGRIEVYITAEK